ncbi:MAG: hypothetical protein ACRET8_10795 [Burkholderiales bacterium]
MRKALRDDPDKPAYIQTIPKGGYRLVAQVRPSATAAPQPVHAERKRRVPALAAAGIALGLLLLMAAGVLLLKGEHATGIPPGAAPIANPEADRAVQPTIAILPFEAIGNDTRAILLAHGITADLGTDLSKVFGLSVIDIAPLGALETGKPSIDALPIRYLVSGSVQRVEHRLRLNVRLTDAATGRQLWSGRFERDLSDFFALQEEIAPKILRVLPAKVSDAELRRVARRYTHSLQAYELFQRGESALLARQESENDAARDLFRRAIALDANFARAYAGLALTYAADYRHQWTKDGSAALERASELAQTAYQISPEIPETYWVLAFVNLERRHHEQALQYLETAVRLFPSFADGYALMGGVDTYIGRPAESVQLLRTALRLNPQGSYLYFLLLGRAYLFLGDLEQARVNLEQALSRNAVNLEARVYLAALHVTAGDKAAAAWDAEEIRGLQPGFTVRSWLRTYPMTDARQKAMLAQALGKLGF